MNYFNKPHVEYGAFRQPVECITQNLHVLACYLGHEPARIRAHKTSRAGACANRYAADYGLVHWTYSRDFLSGALVLCDPAAAAAAERRAKITSQVPWLPAWRWIGRSGLWLMAAMMHCMNVRSQCVPACPVWQVRLRAIGPGRDSEARAGDSV